MTTPPADSAPKRWKPLEPACRRVLGVLIEKSKTTPAGYPMTVNAIVTACNQKNNRDPLTTYDDVDVENALGDLRTMEVVSEIDWMGRAAKYKHLAYDWLGVNKAELAVLAELLLRGPQTLGDLRARAARMEPIADLAALQPIVAGLVARGLMIELTPPGRGQLVTHGLHPAREQAELHAGGAEPPTRTAAEPHPPAAPAPLPRASNDELAMLRAEVEQLEARVRELERRLASREG